MVKQIEEEEFIDKISNEDNLLIIDFFAIWCEPCKMLSPVLEEISNERNDLNIYKIDIDRCQELALKYKIEVVPTILIFKNGEVLEKLEGFYTTGELLEEIERYLNYE